MNLPFTTFIAISCLFTALPAFSQADSQQREAVQKYFKGGHEKTAKDSTWTSDRMFKVGVIDDGTSRDLYASYVCGVLVADFGLRGRGISVQIIDIVKLVRTDKWVKLGESRCN